MILAIDVGNSDIVMGGYEDSKLRFTCRCGCDRRKTADEYALVSRAYWGSTTSPRIRLREVSSPPWFHPCAPLFRMP